MADQSRPLILVFSDDADYYLSIDHGFQAEGFLTCLASDLDEIRQLAREQQPHAIVLDCRSGNYRPAELCSLLQQDADAAGIPLVALVSDGAERDYVDLVKSGVNDIFIRPVLPAKLIACLHSLLEGQYDFAERGTQATRAVRYADVVVNLATHRVQRNGRTIHLSPIEFKLLLHLMQNAEHVMTREELKDAAWQKGIHVGPRTVDVHVGRLRKALLAASDKDLIRTVRSVGYAFSDQSGDEAKLGE